VILLHKRGEIRRNKIEAILTVNRRQFIKTSSASALMAGMFTVAFAKGKEDPAVGLPLAPWRKGHYQVHFIHTGAGESTFHIFPDGTTMLLDCGDMDWGEELKHLYVPRLPNASRHAAEWVARYVKRVNPSGDHVDWLHVSHLHRDHMGHARWIAGRDNRLGLDYFLSGFTLAAEQLHFSRAIDRGYPDFSDPVPYVEDHDRMVEHLKNLYTYLGKRDGLVHEKFKLGAVDQICQLKNPVDGFHVRNICVNGRIAMPDGTVVDPLHQSDGTFIKVARSAWVENPLSCGCVFSYGKFRYYSAGDFSQRLEFPDGTEVYPEKFIGKAAGKVNVAKLNHHGHHCMERECVCELAARVWIACVHDQHHVTEDTMSRIADRNIYSGERIICPTVFTAERRAADFDKPWYKDVASPTYCGTHIVLDVPPGGETYSLTFVPAVDESMKVSSVMRFIS
jgi:hypothetical protein